jgi:phosphonate transport system permease protein
MIRTGGVKRLSFARLSLYGFLLLALLSWGFILMGGDSGVSGFSSGKTWSNASRFLQQLAGADSDVEPAFLQPARWWETGKLAYDTLAMSVLAIGLAGGLVLLTFLPGARNVGNGDLGGAPSRRWNALYHLVRLTFALTRAVPELVWALLIVFVLSPGILAGAVALGLHNYGVLGKLSAEVVENLDPAPARSLRGAGASNLQMLMYGIIPQALPHFLTYLLYRWEVVIRTTVVVGFVSAGGLGRELRLSLSFFHYTDAAHIIIWYLILVAGVDLLAAWLRRLARFE